MYVISWFTLWIVKTLHCLSYMYTSVFDCYIDVVVHVVALCATRLLCLTQLLVNVIYNTIIRQSSPQHVVKNVLFIVCNCLQIISIITDTIHHKYYTVSLSEKPYGFSQHALLDTHCPAKTRPGPAPGIGPCTWSKNKKGARRKSTNWVQYLII